MRVPERVPLCQLPWLVLTVAGVVAGTAVTCGVAVVGVVVAGTVVGAVVAAVAGAAACTVEGEVEGDVAGTAAVVGEVETVGAVTALRRTAARDVCSEAEAIPMVMPAKDRAPAAPAASRARRAGCRRLAGGVELRMAEACRTHLATGSRTAPHILRNSSWQEIGRAQNAGCRADLWRHAWHPARPARRPSVIDDIPRPPTLAAYLDAGCSLEDFPHLSQLIDAACDRLLPRPAAAIESELVNAEQVADMLLGGSCEVAFDPQPSPADHRLLATAELWHAELLAASDDLHEQFLAALPLPERCYYESLRTAYPVAPITRYVVGEEGERWTNCGACGRLLEEGASIVRISPSRVAGECDPLDFCSACIAASVADLS